MSDSVAEDPGSNEGFSLSCRVHEAFGPIDVLVNSAGIGISHQVLEDLPLEDWERCMAINSTGTFLGVKHGIRSMKNTVGAETKSIINISSIEGLIAEPQTAVYCASKGAVRLLTKSTALYCAKAGYNIRCK